jgi:hypothetical protein
MINVPLLKIKALDTAILVCFCEEKKSKTTGSFVLLLYFLSMVREQETVLVSFFPPLSLSIFPLLPP